MFHGFSVVELINVLDVVNRYFPDVAIPDDLREHIEHVRTIK